MGGFDTEVGSDGAVAPAPEPPRRFGASHAIISFALVTFGQFAVSGAVALAAVLAAAAKGQNLGDQRVATAAINDTLLVGISLSIVASAAITLVVTRILARHLVRDRSEHGLGLFVPGWRPLLLWLAAGVGVGLLYAGMRFSIPTEWKGGPLGQFVAGNPNARLVVAIIATLYAPIFEELLFRGLMLRGMIASWGVKAAGIVVTVLFFALHLPETIGYWPGMLAILVVSVVTLLARLRTGSLVPSMAAHFGYNLIAVAMLFTPRP